MIKAIAFKGTCDGRECAENMKHVYASASELRAEMQRLGWIFLLGKWFCPACAAKRKGET